MTIQDFMLEAESAVRDYFSKCDLGSIEVDQVEVVKANDTRLYGLRLVPKGAHAGWTVYLDDLYSRYEEGEAMDELLEEAAYRCEDGLEFEIPAEPNAMDLSFEKIRDRLSVRLLGIRNNMTYMAGRPYIDVGCGLALIPVINCERNVASEWVLAVTEDLLRSMIGCSREELLSAALENTVNLEPPVLMSLSDYVYSNFVRPVTVQNYLADPEMPPEKRKGALMLTNSSTFFGAAVLYYPGLREKIAALLGCGYYVLPSSVHEVMIIPDDAEPDLTQMKATVLEANASVVDRSELLSDNVMHYDPEKCELSIVRDDYSGMVRERSGHGRSIA